MQLFDILDEGVSKAAETDLNSFEIFLISIRIMHIHSIKSKFVKVFRPVHKLLQQMCFEVYQ